MIEREMQELLWRYPEKFLHEPLKPFAWETSSSVGRADLVFEDRHGRLLIIEVKKGTLPRGAIDQLLDYFGMMKKRFPDKPVEMMVVANTIIEERKLTCESYHIECRPISEKKFRDVAEEVGYTFNSESTTPNLPPAAPVGSSTTSRRDSSSQNVVGRTPTWSYAKTVQSSANVSVENNEQEFLSRCDAGGREFFGALFTAQKTASHQSKITWNHESGFSLQFYFHRLGYASMVWGFPAKNRDGKSIRERLDFPFDFSLKAGVSEAFVNEFGASLSSFVPFSGGGKRPSISIGTLASSTMGEVIETIFNFAARASQK